MTTLLFIFICSLGLSLVLTAGVREVCVRFGAVDMPDHRKVHKKPIPRTGGVAIFISFLLTLIAAGFLPTDISDLLVIDRKIFFVFAGGFVCFGIGLLDDLIGAKPLVKLSFQVFGGALAFMGGIDITQFQIGGFVISFRPFDLLVTVFWFVLFMNAVNLIDGLDGLAGGIVVFASVVMVVLSILKADFFTAVLFTALAGSVLGFLRYNFNPASIFMGDSGSYFLGYAIAAMSIMGSVKSQVAPAMMMPLLALGVPLFDTILSPVRRFIRGKKMFKPDNRHIHHRLKKMGFTTIKSVSILYGVTAFLCVAALVMVNIRDERAGLFLVLLGAGTVIFIRKLGYFEYVGTDKLLGWLRDLTDESGLSWDRRGFLNHQIEISRAGDVDEMWERLVEAADFLRLDFVEMRLSGPSSGEAAYLKKAPFEYSTGELNSDLMDWNRTLHVILPLAQNGNRYGSLAVSKDMVKKEVSPFMLRRIEQLRRTVVDKLNNLNHEALIEEKRAG